MDCTMSQRWKPCGMVWRDGLCYKCWHEAGPGRIVGVSPRENRPRGTVIQAMGETPGR